MNLREGRLKILKQVEDGIISLEEASRLLVALENQGQAAVGQENPGLLEHTANTPTLAENSSAAGKYAAGLALPLEVVSEAPSVLNQGSIENNPLRGGDNPSQPDTDSQVTGHTVVAEEPPRAPFWRGWWLLVFIPGLLLVAASVEWMYEGFLAARLGWGVWLSLIPFGFGVLLIWLGWEIRTARWLHIRIQQKPGSHPSRLTISLPLPTRLISWGIRRFGRFAPPAHGQDVAEFLEQVDQAVATEGPLHVYVDDKDGEQVELWIDGSRT